MFDRKTDRLNGSYVTIVSYCDDFSTNLTISCTNKCIQYFSPLTRHHSAKMFAGPPAVAFVRSASSRDLPGLPRIPLQFSGYDKDVTAGRFVALV